MKTRLNKGFTLIELLVVIAIIGILSGIVLTSLNSARNKAANARITASLSQVRTIAETLYDQGVYPATFVVTDVTSGLKALNDDVKLQEGGVAPAGITINGTMPGSVYAAYAPLKTAGFWCVDSVGHSNKTALTPGAVTECPGS